MICIRNINEQGVCLRSFGFQGTRPVFSFAQNQKSAAKRAGYGKTPNVLFGIKWGNAILFQALTRELPE